MSTISVPKSGLTLKNFLFIVLISIVTEFLYFKCSGENGTGYAGGKFDPTTSARAIPPIQIIDSTIKPKVLNTPYSRKIDTLDMIINQYLGKSLSVDGAEQLKTIFFRITKELRTDSTLKK